MTGHNETLYSREGTTQGDPLSMGFYAVGVLLLIRKLKDLKRGVQTWYADDSSMAAMLQNIISWFRQLIEQGPGYGYFPEPSKSVLVVNEEERLKMSKHKQDCLDNRADFVPLVFSADGCMGEQAKKYLQRVGKVLAGKWEKSYSEVMGFVMGRVSIAVARASSMCIRAS